MGFTNILLISYFIYSTVICAPPISDLSETTSTISTSTSTYETKYDNIDLDEILESERLLKNYVKCLELTGPCTPDGKLLRDTLPDAIATDCSKCSTKQKYGSDKVIQYLIDQKPEDWQRLEKIYDQEGSYRKRYLAMKEKPIEFEKN